MKKLQFKTNIHCGNCIKTVTPILNTMDEVDEWKVDLENADKVLTVEGEAFTSEEIVSKLGAAGFRAEIL